jgi:uncharacterized protein YeaO (DUF488 family)
VPAKFDEFARRYRAELADATVPLDQLRALPRTKPVTLLYGAHDEAFNQARVLKDYLDDHRGG